MKSKLIFLIVSVFLFSFCSNTNKTENQDNKDTSIVKTEDDLKNNQTENTNNVQKEKKEININKLIPELSKHLSKEAEFNEKLKRYLFLLTSEIQSVEEIKQVFEMRNDLRYDFEDVSFQMYEQFGYANYQLWEKVEKELNFLGYSPYYAEGYLEGVGDFPILENEIEKYGTEDFKLYTDYFNKKSETFGGEYPFMDLHANIELVKIWETINQKYPQSSFTKEINDFCYWDIAPLFDVHNVVSDDGNAQLIIEDLGVDMYPGGTYEDNYIDFVEAGNTKLSAITEKVLKNISEIEIDANYSFDKVYLVVIERVDDYEEAQKKILKYISNNQDIVHIISVTEDSYNWFNYLVYRFYTDKSKAEKALEQAKQINSNASIVVVNNESLIID